MVKTKGIRTAGGFQPGRDLGRQGKPHAKGGNESMLNEGNTEAVRLESVLERENLRRAWKAVARNKGTPGVDGQSIKECAAQLKIHWETLERKLLAGEYRPGAVKAVDIPKGNGKMRRLGIPNVSDRVIQQAIQQILSPVWEPEFSDYSYGFRPKRSAHDAIRRAQGYVKAGKTWVVDIDLKNFFDQVDHDILMGEVAKKVRDKRLLKLIGDYLRAPMRMPDGHQEKRRKGTPQGGPLSPLLANIYLDPLDKELEKRGLAFVRYADDIAIFTSSPRSAERVLDSIIQWIEKHLKLEVNREKSGSGPCDQSGILGFRLYPEGEIGVTPKSILKLKARVRELWDARQNLTSNELRDQWQRFITGWWEYYKLADRLYELQSISGWIRRHIRKCFWLRWKSSIGRYRMLKKLGVNRHLLTNAFSSKGAWRMAKNSAINQALRTKTLIRFGFIIPWDFVKAK